MPKSGEGKKNRRNHVKVWHEQMKREVCERCREWWPTGSCPGTPEEQRAELKPKRIGRPRNDSGNTYTNP
jgi:hypothetical protein